MMTKGKKIVSRMLSALRVPELSLRAPTVRPRIFLYHGVSPDIPGYGIFNYRKKFLAPEVFRRELAWISRHFIIIPLPLLIERIQNEDRLSPRTAAITFDDGYGNFYEHAFPILKEFSLQATFFITTDLADQKAPLWVDTLEYAIGHARGHALRASSKGKEEIFNIETYGDRMRTDMVLRDRLKKLPRSEAEILLDELVNAAGANLQESFLSSPYRGITWEEAREMERAGMTFAPHTRSHPILSRIPASDAKEEILFSRKRLQEELDAPLDIFAYPNGQPEDITPEIISIIQKAGFRAALTTIPGAIGKNTNPYLLPRITLDDTDSFPAFKNTAAGITHQLRRALDALKK